MDIEVLYVEDCPNVELARERIAAALQAVAGVATVSERLVTSHAEAERRGMRGSPTVLLDGLDVAAGEAGPSISCRLYRSDGRLEGAPSVATLVEAFAR